MLTGSSKYLVIKAGYSDGAEEMIGDKADYHSTESEFIIGEPGKITALKDGESVITISYTRGDITKAIVVNVRSTSFPLTNELFNPSIWETGTFDEATGELVTGLYGFGGWKYNSGIDLSEYKYLIAELDSDNTCSASFRLFDKGYWEGAHTADFGSSRKVSVDLHNMYKEVNGVRTKVDPS